VALTLLDPETTFWSSGNDALAEFTGAKVRPRTEAAFVFAGADSELWSEAILEADRGTLADPHRGATVLVAAPVPGEGEGRAHRLTGPGIETSVTVRLPGGSPWLEARRTACIEFPLGVDVIWARPDGTVVALPRTTRIEEV
jgi:alpha-D-ribose 1-methylphosphonate 5-triphosphate synthase subunit PhnH